MCPIFFIRLTEFFPSTSRNNGKKLIANFSAHKMRVKHDHLTMWTWDWLLIEMLKPVCSKGVWTRAFKHHTPICLRVVLEELELQTVCDQTGFYIIRPLQKEKKKNPVWTVKTDHCSAVCKVNVLLFQIFFLQTVINTKGLLYYNIIFSCFTFFFKPYFPQYSTKLWIGLYY